MKREIASRSHRRMQVPVHELVDLSKIRADGRAPTPREIREALPRGWVLDEDGVTAHRDARVMFAEGWVLVVGLVCFAAAAIGFFAYALPRGVGGWLRLAIVAAVLVLVGGIVAPLVTRALNRR